mmetsp:Transcript_6997/g.15095  ORF Transcript_6997/g.15095 Transcript_6997/m.15095 type:complete len:880 (-) Transcript_6997:4-2643(-)
MGKQSKRKGGKRKSGQQTRPTGLVDDVQSSNPPAAGEGPVANVIKKIRHGDPRVRHAALVALSSTLYDSSSLSSAAADAGMGNFRRDSGAASANNPTLLRALAARILDPDVPCATAAAGCLSNYVGFYAASVSGMTVTNEESEEVNVASEVMVPIMLQRVQMSLEAVNSLGEKISESVNTTGTSAAASSATAKNNKIGSQANEKHWLSSQEQWEILSLTLQTLAGLIENCPMAVQRMSGGFSSSTTTSNVFASLLQVLALSANFLKLLDRENVAVQQQNQKCEEPILDAATNSARALHSLLDENDSLIASIPTTVKPATAPSNIPFVTIFSALEELKKTIVNTHFSAMTRLHASGVFFSLRKVLVIDKEASGSSFDASGEQVKSTMQTCASDVVLPMLHSRFDLKFYGSDSNNPNELVKRMVMLSKEISAQKQDEQMESQIVKEINQRKEPARMIARRQKKLREEREKFKQCNQQRPEAMDDDDIATKDVKTIQVSGAMVVEQEGDEKKPDQSSVGDLKDELDGVVQSWRNLMGSYKLALELIANLCAGKDDEENEEGMLYGDGEDDEHMWDSDDEAKLIAAVGTSNSQSAEKKCTPSELDLFSSMTSKRLLEQILSFFSKWLEFLPSIGTDCPALVIDDVNELLSTCSLCLGNAIACDLPMWSCSPMKSTILVGSDSKVVDNGVQLFWWELLSSFSAPWMSSDADHAVKSHVTFVMLSMLRHQPQARTLIDSTQLDLIFALLSIKPKENDNYTLQVMSNAIAMLGILCSEPHPSTVDSRVCSALLERLRSATSNENDITTSIIAIHEILNVLMDMYGGDDCNDEIFAKNDVLGHFKRCLPWFKRQVKKISAGRRNREETETWSETALNASRFIKYKGG